MSKSVNETTVHCSILIAIILVSLLIVGGAEILFGINLYWFALVAGGIVIGYIIGLCLWFSISLVTALVCSRKITVLDRGTVSIYIEPDGKGNAICTVEYSSKKDGSDDAK